MDQRLLKIIIGLALESALVYRRVPDNLVSLYDEPKIDEIGELHDRLIDSPVHIDREIAIWLELALESGHVESSPNSLIREMREMEMVLHSLINRAGRAQKEINLWMDYVANAANLLQDGFWIDAKIMLSRGLQTSRTSSIEELKSEISFRYEVDVLQKATVSYFEELKGYPLKLVIPDEEIENVLSVEKVLLRLMLAQHEKESEEKKFYRNTVHRLSNAMRYLMEADKKPEAKKQLVLALREVESWLGSVDDETERELRDYGLSIKEIEKNL